MAGRAVSVNSFCRFLAGGRRATPETMERVAGIEPAYLAWKANVLPLNYTRPGIVVEPLPKLGRSVNRLARETAQDRMTAMPTMVPIIRPRARMISITRASDGGTSSCFSRPFLVR